MYQPGNPYKTYLEEQKVNKLQRAASLADDYKFTHKSSTAPESKLQRQVEMLTQLGQIRKGHPTHGSDLPMLTVKEQAT